MSHNKILVLFRQNLNGKIATEAVQSINVKCLAVFHLLQENLSSDNKEKQKQYLEYVHIAQLSHNIVLLYPLANKVWGIYRNHPICLSVCLSSCWSTLSVPKLLNPLTDMDISHNCYPQPKGVWWPWTKVISPRSRSQCTHRYNPCPSLNFLCRLRSIATYRDHFIRRLSVRPSVCPSVTHAELCFAGDTCIPRNAATIFTAKFNLDIISHNCCQLKGVSWLWKKVISQRSRSQFAHI